MASNPPRTPAPQTPRPLGRHEQFDEASRRFSIGETLREQEVIQNPLRSYTWRVPDVFDQGEEGACVGFSILGELAARPVEMTELPNTLGFDIYNLAKRLDPWQGENYEGTSVLAGMKAATEMGYFTEYRWAFSLEDTLRTLGYFGPVILGCNWYSWMYDPMSCGFLHPMGSVVGGHAIVVNGCRVSTEDGTLSTLDWDKSWVTIQNSWGPEWGDNGQARIMLADFDRLRREQGEIAVPVARQRLSS